MILPNEPEPNEVLGAANIGVLNAFSASARNWPRKVSVNRKPLKIEASQFGCPGPRKSSVGAIGRHRLTIHPVVMRLTANGAPAVGGTDAGAIAALRQELALASATWGQCGITFGPVTPRR